MYTPSQDVDLLARKMIAKRIEASATRRRREREQFVNMAAAKGTLNSGNTEARLREFAVEAFNEACTGVVADLLSLAGDLGDSLEVLKWGRSRALEFIEQHGESLARSFESKQGPGPGTFNTGRHSEQGPKAAFAQKRDAEITFDRAMLRVQPPQAQAGGTTQVEQRNFFISHAGEDRPDCVQPLVDELERRGKTVWYSEDQLALGDSLLRKIDDGLLRSRYGVVVLSPHFFRKPWPRMELEGLAARAVAEGRKVILPVWHGLDHDGVVAHSPTLGALLGISTAHGIPRVADEIIRAAEADSAAR
jgi:hypothetical protein